MSASDALLLFLGREGGFDGWLRLAEGVVAERGAGVEGLPAPGEGGGIVAVVPGEEVSIHWLELPGALAPAQAAAAARLLTAEVSAQPIAEMHVAVGPAVDGSDMRCVALVPALAMGEWLGRMLAQGLDPDSIVAEPLLLPAPDEGIARYGSLYRGQGDAFAIEPHLAELALAGRAVTEIDQESYEAGLAIALDRLPVDLRQGAFARRREWKIDWRRVRRLVQLAAAILLVTIAIQIVAISRYTEAADALEAETARIAARAVPGGGDGIEDLDRRLGQLRGAGAGYSALASTLFAAVRATANAELSAMAIEADGNLRVTIRVDTPATLAALSSRLEASGFAVETGPLRSGGGRQVAELTMRAR